MFLCLYICWVVVHFVVCFGTSGCVKNWSPLSVSLDQSDLLTNTVVTHMFVSLDLTPGDVHIIPLDDVRIRQTGKYHVSIFLAVTVTSNIHQFNAF